MKVVILGATGMLGFEVFTTCIKRNINVHAVIRNKSLLAEKAGLKYTDRIHEIDDIKNIDAIERIISDVKPSHIINCIGIVKQSSLADDYYESIAVNSFLPHQLQKICGKYGSQLIHISTDCVFDGKKGLYKESDLPNANDLYGKSKHLGEVGYGCGITLRTSIIGHEIMVKTHGLLEWFLAQEAKVKGFTRAIFSGLTTGELTRIILDIIIPLKLPPAVYHVSGQAISKYDLIKIIAEVYEKKIEIQASDELVIDRSLDSSVFMELTGYNPPGWRQLIVGMHDNFMKKNSY